MLRFNKYQVFYSWKVYKEPYIFRHRVSKKCILFGGFILVSDPILDSVGLKNCKILGSKKDVVDSMGYIMDKKEYSSNNGNFDQTVYWFETLEEAELFWNTHKKISLKEFCKTFELSTTCKNRIISLKRHD